MAATSYFDIDNEAHIGLLPETMRGVDDIANVAARTERDVISMYTMRASPNTNPMIGLIGDPFINQDLGLVIFLIGYRQEANNPNTDPDLLAALTDTIADVIEWRLRRRLKDPMVSAQSDDSGKSTTYREDARHDFPLDWDWRLEPFDARPPMWSL